MTLDDNRVLGSKPVVISKTGKSEDTILYPVVAEKSKVIKDNYNELSLDFEGDYSVIFRAYDDGIAYRFKTNIDRPITVVSEEVKFNFKANHNIYFPEEESLHSHSEREYKYMKINKISKDMFCSIPALVDINDGPKVAITEADLLDYPGMYLYGQNNNNLYGKFPPVALEEEQTSDRDVKVTKSADYIAKTKGSRTFPWRVMVIAEEDGDLIESQMVYKLATPVKLKNTSWIKPGKVAWDWYNANKITGVDFEVGINTQTYKYYIDFASKYGIEYIILDEGWYVLGDLLKVSEGMDIPELFRYAKSKNVDIILWMSWKTLDEQFDRGPGSV